MSISLSIYNYNYTYNIYSIYIYCYIITRSGNQETNYQKDTGGDKNCWDIALVY